MSAANDRGATGSSKMFMSYQGFTYTFEHGTVRGVVYYIGARLEPSIDNVEDFAIVLFFELASGEVVRVATVDNTEHVEGRIHVHRNYRESGTAVRDFDVDISSWIEAEDYLRKHAERMVRTYIETHGRRSREGI